MYARVVERICRKAFGAVNRHNYDVLLSICRPDIVHRFGGDHALGGTRHAREGLALWFQRIGRVMPTLAAPDRGSLGERRTLENGRRHPMDGDGEVARWQALREPRRLYPRYAVGKAVSIDANQDIQAVADVLRRQAAYGIDEAMAAPIET